MYTLATIVTPDKDTAQLLFLIAAILFGVAAILHLVSVFPARGAEPAAPHGGWGWPVILVDAGLLLTALGLLWS